MSRCGPCEAKRLASATFLENLSRHSGRLPLVHTLASDSTSRPRPRRWAPACRRRISLRSAVARFFLRASSNRAQRRRPTIAGNCSDFVAYRGDTDVHDCRVASVDRVGGRTRSPCNDTGHVGPPRGASWARTGVNRHCFMAAARDEQASARPAPDLGKDDKHYLPSLKSRAAFPPKRHCVKRGRGPGVRSRERLMR